MSVCASCKYRDEKIICPPCGDSFSGYEVMKKKKDLRILIACEFSGAVRDAFIKRGYNAWSCDILPSEGIHKDKHFHMKIEDVRKHKTMCTDYPYWDLLIAHPPCTYLCNSGVRWLNSKKDGFNDSRYEKMVEGAKFFKDLLNFADAKYIAIENPIPHKYAANIIGEKYKQIIQPYQFGQMERKATCLWLKGLPELIPTNDVKEEMLKLPKNISQRLHHLPPGPERAKLRSTTFQGIADAMAEQWGNFLINAGKTDG